ncbi:MAG: hypothetical protein AAGA43_13510 [Bacteroidota bacterium]
MKETNKSLSLTLESDGSLTYDCNSHIDRFTFIGSDILKTKQENLTEEGKSLRARFTEYMLRLSGVDANALNHEDLTKYYLERGIGDIPHCVHQYVSQNYYQSLVWDGKKCQKAYLDGVDYLNGLADQGKIPRKNIPFGLKKNPKS